MEKFSRSPDDPGVYLMKDRSGTVIYVGKAKHLKKRLASYFSKACHTNVKTGILVGKIADFETLITKTEQEALILESNLIRRYKPHYNVILKDDKRYPLIRIQMGEPYPYIEKVRRIVKDGNLYFGPFAAASSLNATLTFIRKTFKLRNCKKKVFQARTRPCLNYQMGHCMGPCSLDVPQETYMETVKEVILFLKGRMPQLSAKVKHDMLEASEREDFERAALFRDKWRAIESVMEKQTVVSTDMADRDVIAAALSDAIAVVTILQVRNGYWVGTRHFEIPLPFPDEKEILSAFVNQYYEDQGFIPPEILLGRTIEEKSVLESWLRDKKGKRVDIASPRRGEKTDLIDMARRNAENELKTRIESGSRLKSLLERLQRALHMERPPSRIECFDNSHFRGEEAVSGMVVFIGGAPEKKFYRKYRIREGGDQDDYGYMKEVLTRRFTRSEGDMAWPDLLMVDGGKGQLNIALAVLKELSIDDRFQVIGIAKKDTNKGETEDKIFLPARANPVVFGKERDLLLFLQRIRDEAHRFAVTFHRQSKKRSLISSLLDDIPGIGKKRRDMLLEKYGGISGIKGADIGELSVLQGMSLPLALRLKEHLESQGNRM
jgi:excinuclease ABC subunit C